MKVTSYSFGVVCAVLMFGLFFFVSPAYQQELSADPETGVIRVWLAFALCSIVNAPAFGYAFKSVFSDRILIQAR